MDIAKKTMTKVLCFLISLALLLAMMPVTNVKADDRKAGRDKTGHIVIVTDSGARHATRSDSDELDEAKALAREYIDEAFSESVASESSYCDMVWEEILATYNAAQKYVDDATEVSELITIALIFVYVSDELNEMITYLETLGALTKDEVKSAASIPKLAKEKKKELAEIKTTFAALELNDYYRSEANDLLDEADDLLSALTKNPTLKNYITLTNFIDENLGDYYEEEDDDDVTYFDIEEEEEYEEYGTEKVIYTNDALDELRENVVAEANDYISLQLKKSGYKGDTKKLKAMVTSLKTNVKKIERAENIEEAGEECIAKMVALTGIEYEELESGDAERLQKKLETLAMQYTRTDYDEDDWTELLTILAETTETLGSTKYTVQGEAAIDGLKAQLDEIPTLAERIASAKKSAIKKLKTYTGKYKKKYVQKKVKPIVKKGIKAINAASELEKVNSLRSSYVKKANNCIKRYKITTKKKGKGTISKSKKVSYGKKYTVKFTPRAGWKIRAFYVDGKWHKAKSSYTFKNVKKKHVIKVIFSR